MARTRILLRIGMVMTMASRDFACTEAAESRAAEDVCKGGRVREESG